MNALPLKNPHSPGTVIDELIADFGIKSVVLALASRLLKRKKRITSEEFPGLADQYQINDLTDHLRADLGLPPEQGHKIHIDPIMFKNGGFF